MEINLTKSLITACFDAKDLVDMMPELPKGVTPLAIRILDTIEQLTREQGCAHPRDVAKARKLALPSVTRSLKALEKLGAVKKETDPEDRRFIKLTLTSLGQSWYDKYVDHFYQNYANALGNISEADAKIMIDVITKMNQAMRVCTKEEFYGRNS